jgi:Tfp pilus assembly protein PilW
VRNRRHRRRGLTLAEVAISTLLTGLVMVGALRCVGAVWRTWEVAADRNAGTALASQLLDEVLSQPYAEAGGGFGPEAGETTRAGFDDVDDFDNWTESPPADAAGNPLAGLAGWIRSVDVKKLAKNSYTETPDGSGDKGLRKITVTVTDPGSRTHTTVAFRSSVAGTLQPQGVDVTIVTWVGCNLRVGAAGQAVSTGTTVSNHAEDRTP